LKEARSFPSNLNFTLLVFALTSEYNKSIYLPTYIAWIVFLFTFIGSLGMEYCMSTMLSIRFTFQCQKIVFSLSLSGQGVIYLKLTYCA